MKKLIMLAFLAGSISAFSNVDQEKIVRGHLQLLEMNYHIVATCWYDSQTFALNSRDAGTSAAYARLDYQDLWEKIEYKIRDEGVTTFFVTKKIVKTFYNTRKCPDLLIGIR